MIKAQQGSEEINSTGGNILIGALLQLKSWERLNNMQAGRIKHGEIGHRDILKIAAALLSLGRSNFTDVELIRKDPLLKEAFNLPKVPSAETLRQRLNDLALCNGDQALIDDSLVEMLRKVRNSGNIRTAYSQHIPLEIDVSVMLQPNGKKEGVSWTYHNAMGFAPVFCSLGTHGYMLANELRNGSQHSVKGAVDARKIGLSPEELLVRVDSGHDDADFLETLSAVGVKFFVKRNLRKEMREPYLAIARRCGEKISSRDGKDVYRCTLSHRKPKGWEDIPLFMVVEVIERLTSADDQESLIPEVEVSTWRTNLPEGEAVCIELYSDHAAVSSSIVSSRRIWGWQGYQAENLLRML